MFEATYNRNWSVVERRITNLINYSSNSIANALSCTYLLRFRPSYLIGFRSLLQDSLKLQPLQLLTILRVDLTDCCLILSPDGDVHLIVKSCLQLPAVRWKISKVTINWLLCTFIIIETSHFTSVYLSLEEFSSRYWCLEDKCPEFGAHCVDPEDGI